MMAETWVACTASAAGVPEIVTSPAPLLRAASAASREAPVCSGPPDTTTA